MRLLILLVLLAAVFFGGYYAGRQPGSPDVFGWMNKGRQMVSDAVGQAGGHDFQGARTVDERDQAFAGTE